MLNRRLFLAAGAGAVATGCSTIRGPQRMAFARPAPLAPLKMSPDRLTRITVCTRPFRPAGPRLEAEAMGGKMIVHNYGHGGSGWSLSWGCAMEASALALSGGKKKFAVIGAGVMGLTTALRLIETGAEVTIYAKEFPMETRSSRATGVWSPSSRIGLADAVDGGFLDRWDRWARTSFAEHQRFVGSVGDPVEFVQMYALSDNTGGSSVPEAHEFLHLDRRLNDITPAWSRLSDDAHPFPVARAQSGLNLTFNVASYAQRLTQEFLMRGGRMVRRDFPDRGAVFALSEPVIVNCTGYGAKALWEANELIPVRGQINWLAAQLEARYGVFYNQVYALSRRDGIIVQYVGPNDDWGYGDDSEAPDREEMTNAVGTIGSLFSA
jgi:D-amino-acid oxidase